MKKIFNFIQSIWNKFLNLFKQRNVSFETDITNTINDFMTNNNIHFKFNIRQDLNNIHRIIISFSVSNNNNIETILLFSKSDNIHKLEILEGNSNIEGMHCVKRSSIYIGLDMLNNRLHSSYISIYEKYYS